MDECAFALTQHCISQQITRCWDPQQLDNWIHEIQTSERREFYFLYTRNCNEEKISPQHPRRKGLKPPSSSLPKLEVLFGPSVQNPCRQPIVPGVPPRPSCWLFQPTNNGWFNQFQWECNGLSMGYITNNFTNLSLSKNRACPNFLPGPFYRG